jgi:hypothetical protein
LGTREKSESLALQPSHHDVEALHSLVPEEEELLVEGVLLEALLLGELVDLRRRGVETAGVGCVLVLIRGEAVAMAGRFGCGCHAVGDWRDSLSSSGGGDVVVPLCIEAMGAFGWGAMLDLRLLLADLREGVGASAMAVYCNVAGGLVGGLDVGLRVGGLDGGGVLALGFVVSGGF